MDTPSSASDSEFDQWGDDLQPNPALALFQHPRAEELRTTLSESLPYCSGTLELPTECSVLFYGKGESACRLDLANPTPSALEHLERTCDPATFGVDNRDVLDESYRKAGKLDNQCFAFNLDVGRVGLLEAIRMGLFPGRDERKAIHAELYKLNVYGKDSFFKSHKDTPRGTSMFGSLVLVLSTPHEGGELILEHQGTRWVYDAAQVLAPLPHGTAPRLAYVAFFSDVDHAVQRVTAGHRLTITYNLHFSSPPTPASLPGLNITQPRAANTPTVERALAALLADPCFLPHGGTLGFGLRHLYPLPTSFRPHTDTTLESLKTRLKGADAALFRACTALNLRPALYSVFEWRDPSHDHREEGSGEGSGRALVAFSRVVQFDMHSHDDEDVLWAKLCRRFDGVLLDARPSSLRANEEGSGEGEGIAWRDMGWVTALSDVNRVRTRFAAYGNEPEIGYLYQRICMLVDVGPPGARG
ncbi:hypothetical protein V8D89_010580, partial [Ganoderma adspersum]